MVVEDLIHGARQRWPGVDLPSDRVAAYIAERNGTEVADLFLACACSDGDVAALRYFDLELVDCVARAVRKLGGNPSTTDEVTQRLRDRLLVGSADKHARIAEYTGRGPLRAWLRVIATREILDMRRREKFEAPLGERTLDGLPAAVDDPALAYLKATYREAFRRAFRTAFASLEPLERDLIRHHHMLGETIDDLARRHTIHRATAARWVARARERLLLATREQMSRELPPSELESVLNLIASQLELSLRSQL